MKWYEEQTQYAYGTPWSAFEEHAGPHGTAIVNVYGEKTQPGWGSERFIQNYSRGFFDPEHVAAGKPFALVMRSLKILCVDIDGKNDGYREAHKLDLPRTLAETSKSGNGHHLFYEYEDEWDDEAGYVAQPDRVGMWPGIDIKSSGVVYHHTHQRWNKEPIAQLPTSVWERLQQRNIRDAELRITPSQVAELTDEDLKFKRDILLIELSTMRTDGRDTSLWRIGASLLNLGVDEQYMAEKILAAGLRWGVERDTLENKIIPNIIKHTHQRG